MNSIFGWDYPPGCNGTPYDEADPPCEVCGEDIDSCICQKCPVCGEYGNPECYINHGLRRTEKQKFFLECNKRAWEDYCDEIYYLENQFSNDICDE